MPVNARAMRGNAGSITGLSVFQKIAALLVAVTLLRLIGLKLSAVDLYFDEAQYWAWAQELAFGYYSKPPLLAWLIATAELVCGSSEACVRAPAPLLHFATALLIFRIAQEMYGDEAGAFASLTYFFAPGIVFSSRIISTDVPLLFFWSLALFSFLQLRAGGKFQWCFVLGISLGFGLLSKYAMIYFLVSLAAAALLDRKTRMLLASPPAWTALIIAGLMLVPNILWNIENQFSTFRHTGDNMRGGGFRINPLNAAEFLATQFAVIGPAAFTSILLALFSARGKGRDNDRLLLAFTIPVLALITFTALMSRAHPNWAATAYVAGCAVAAGWLLRAGARRWAVAGVLFGIVIQSGIIAADALAHRIQIPLLKNADVYRPTLGWRELGEKTARIAFRLDVGTVVSESRRDLASLTYYLRNDPVQVFAWPRSETPGNHFELTRPLPAGSSGPILLITECASRERLDEQFRMAAAIGQIVDSTGPSTVRTHYAFLLSDPRGPLRPLSPCERS
jgi:hypothetical protein